MIFTYLMQPEDGISFSEKLLSQRILAVKNGPTTILGNIEEHLLWLN